MNPEENMYIREIQKLNNQLVDAETKNVQANRAMATTMFESDGADNLIKWQLDIKEELERIEHLLRKHIPKRDENGNEYFEEPDESDQLFNERGIQEVLNILAWYLNKNIILSNFSKDEISQRVHQFSKIFTNFILINYREFGLDTPEKIKHFPMVVMNVVNIIESTYHRAMNGGERDSLRTARTVTQSEPIGMNRNYPTMPMAKPKTSIFNPKSWGRM